jgi:hypothetical protein
VSDRPCVQYAYDQYLRLVKITDPKGQTFLQNFYDEQGRVKKQQHGDGSFEFNYEPFDQTGIGSLVYRTKVKLKNGGLLSLRHDQFGHVVERILHVSARALSPGDQNQVTEGTSPLTTTSNFNRHGELIQRTYPAGNSIKWLFDHDNADPRAQGNILSISQIPIHGSGNDISPLVTRYTYEPHFQQVASDRPTRVHNDV